MGNNEARWAWRRFDDAITNYHKALKALEYTGIFAAPSRTRTFPEQWWQAHFMAQADTLTLPQIEALLGAQALGPPLGLDVLAPVPLPQFPVIPAIPTEPEPYPLATPQY